MNQGRNNQVYAESTPVVSDDTQIQQKLSERQAKRAAKAAGRWEKSDALKEEGNAYFLRGNFQEALDRYQAAVDVHGSSAKPVLLTNLAATYLKLGMYPEAHDAASKALTADPRCAKARCQRGMARKHMEMWRAAEIDFRTLLTLDPGNEEAKAELVSVMRVQRDQGPREEGLASDSELEAPGLEQDPEVAASLSESSDCEHIGNRIPCKFYNRGECRNGRECRYSHAPDQRSERDALGRNVCRCYLIGTCKFGKRCSYVHDKEYLLQPGWWSTPEGVDKESRKVIADHDTQNGTFGTRKRKRGCRGRSRRKVARRSQPGPSSQTVPQKHVNSSLEGHDSDESDFMESEEDPYEGGMCGFTRSETEELICYGVKPWDDDAWDFMHTIRSWN